MSYTEDNGEVVLRMSADDYEWVLFALGLAAGDTSKKGGPTKPWIELMNRLNEGNPHFVPYKLAGEGD